MPKYQFETKEKINVCFDCPCREDSINVCAVDYKVILKLKGKPDWCPLEEVVEDHDYEITNLHSEDIDIKTHKKNIEDIDELSKLKPGKFAYEKIEFDGE